MLHSYSFSVISIFIFLFLFYISSTPLFSLFFFFNDTAATEIYTLSLHDALPIFMLVEVCPATGEEQAAVKNLFLFYRYDLMPFADGSAGTTFNRFGTIADEGAANQDRKSTRLNSSHVRISYAVFCLKKKKSTSLVTASRQPASVTNKTRMRPRSFSMLLLAK